ncbi:MAG: hypothetical protein RQ751_12195, partial [Longimicrobiales bacterium]|nr:hypothetical protein [Longimicrobiales bacterium]
REGGAQVAPDTDWRTLDTPHFAVTFPAGQEAVARHAAARAEKAYAAFEAVLPRLDQGRIELLLTGDVDLSNGLAAVTPHRRIVVYLRPPVDGFALSHFQDWLDLVITHEVAHVFHLDATSPFGGLLRRVFGRLPAAWPFFPGIGTPGWTIEGLATWYESEFTGVGRAEGTYFEMMLRTAAAEGAFSTLDRASGRSSQWPGGESTYLYGSLFFDHLLETHGSDRMLHFVRAVGRQWIPYRLNAAARSAFGVSFDEAWREWTEAWRGRADARATELEAAGGVTHPERLTDGARLAVHARVSREGAVVYARADGRSDPHLHVLDPSRGESRALARTHGAARFDFGPAGEVVLAQPEFQDPYRIFSDLWRVDAAGTRTRLTSGARLDHPTVSPDGTHIVAVRYQGAESRLVRLPAGGGPDALLGPDADTWAFPAYSPDGRWLAAVRWTGSGADVVVLDAASGAVVVEVTNDRALDLAPAWSPDGGTLLWSSDRSGIPQIVAAAVDPARGRPGPVRSVTRVLSGAGFPAVDPAGGWLYFSHYTAEGWELARIPYRPGSWTPAPALDPRFADGSPFQPVAPADGPVRGYAALPSLRPTFWQPILLPGEGTPDGDLLRPFVGFSTWSTDLVGRHGVLLQGALSLSGNAFNGTLGYTYSGLGNPVLDFRAEQEWNGDGPFLARRDSLSDPERLYIREREQRVSLGATLRHTRWTSSLALGLRAGMVWESRSLLDATFGPARDFALRQPDARLAEGQITLSLSTARRPTVSISTEEGVSAFVLARFRREQALADSLDGRTGFDRSTDEVLAQVRWFESFRGPGFADHVLGVRLAGGAASGPGADALTFEVGGTAGQARRVSGLGVFGGTSTFFPVRGYRSGDRFGRYAWVASGEYRLPLARVNRGLGLLPLHLDALHASLFGDAGNAWGPELGIPGFQRPRERALWSVGVELTAETLWFYNTALGLRTGIAFPGVDVPGGGSPVWYLRVGPSF